MAGLSGYVEDGRLSAEGIECACAGLLTFRGILQTLAIDRISVFATALLRNISNTEQALSVIHAATGYFVEVISGEEEALFGYAGTMQELRLSSGAFLDIGGASTEIVTFDGGTPVNFASFSIGSLSLYRRCVKKILPGEGSLKRLRQEISQTIDLSEDAIASHPLLIGVGGTARAALKLAQHYCKISDDCHSITAEQLDALCAFLCSGKKAASDLILRLEAERIQTLAPGLLICSTYFICLGRSSWSSANTASGKVIYGPAKRRGRQDRQQYARPLLRGLYAGHLRPRHHRRAAQGGANDGQYPIPCGIDLSTVPLG